MRKLLFTFVIISISFLNNANGQSVADSLDMELNKLMAKSTLTGMAVAIYNAEGVIYEHAAGYADIAKKIPYSTSHIQNIGSISKTYIAAALMKAVEAGKISLDDPISEYLDFKVINPFTPNAPISVRQLATHTSGVKDGKYYGKAYYLTEDISDWTKEEKKINKVNVKKIAKNPKMSLESYLKAYLIESGKYYNKYNYLVEGPGAAYKYSNVGAGLFGCTKM